VGPDGVVVAGELVELALQRPDRGGGRLRCQPFLLGLVEPFHFAAGLRMVGPGVVELHSKDTEFDLQSDPAVAALFGGEDRPIEFLTDVKLLRLA
jgi:hypothetical protein